MRRVLTAACVAASILSCNKNETMVDGGGTGINTPVYSSLANSFTYTINARNLTMTQAIPLNFSNNRLTILAAVMRSQGIAIFTLSDSQNVAIHADTFSLSGMYRVISVAGMPKSATVAFQAFTGTISYALVGDSLVEGMRVTEFPNTEGSQWVWGMLNEHGRVRMWLVPNVGIVQNDLSTTWDFTNESWELLSYSRIRD